MTTYPFDLTMSNGQVYKTDSGYEQTVYTAGTDFSAAAIDITGFVGLGGITRDQLASGIFITLASIFSSVVIWRRLKITRKSRLGFLVKPRWRMIATPSKR